MRTDPQALVLSDCAAGVPVQREHFRGSCDGACDGSAHGEAWGAETGDSAPFSEDPAGFSGHWLRYHRIAANF